MAFVELDPAIKHIRGKIGRYVYRRLGNRTQVYEAPPPPKKPPTPKQLAVRNRVRAAGKYVHAACADPDLRPEYEAALAREPEKSLSGIAFRDYLTPPVVEHIDLSKYSGTVGDVITVKATDDTGVIRLRVEIRTAEGDVIEHGEAKSDDGERWIYVATADTQTPSVVTISATAWDRPRHSGEAAIEYQL